MGIKNLGGHSGCKIFLIEEENKTFVRKISSGEMYNHRLIAQAEKQSAFSAKHLKAPEIYHAGWTSDGLYYFDMEYIQGVTLAKGIVQQNVNEITDIVEEIMSVFATNHLNDRQIEQKINVNFVFENKIKELRETLTGNGSNALAFAFDYFDTVEWKDFPVSKCHGDLTFENIIIKNGDLYLIDFLDSFFESWVMDASTLLQDSMLLWSYRNKETIDSNLLIKLLVFRDIFVEKLKQISPQCVKQVYQALLLKIVRIYPYTKDEETFKFLDDTILMLKEKLL